MQTTYDLIIIGAGSGGLALARKARHHNASVLLIEKGQTGGTCVNAGCVPKKVTYNLADLLAQVRNGQDYGVDLTYSLNYASFAQRRDEYVKRLNKIYENVIEKEGIVYLRGYGELFDGYVMVDGNKFLYKYCVLATGAKPIILGENCSSCSYFGHKKESVPEINAKESVPEINAKESVPEINANEKKFEPEINANESVPEINANEKKFEPEINANEYVPEINAKESLPEITKNKCKCVTGTEFLKTSDDFFTLTEIPKKTVIIGSGYIAVELAFMLRSLGSEVHIIARGTRILSHFDTVISENVKNALEQKNIKIHFKEVITQIGPTFLKTEKMTLNADFILGAIGRDCDLSFVKTPIKRNGNFLTVNENFETSVRNVYAIGDLIGPRFMLTPVAIFQGRILADHLFLERKEDLIGYYRVYEFVPSVVFSHPPCASVGFSEEEARSFFSRSDSIVNDVDENMKCSVEERKDDTDKMNNDTDKMNNDINKKEETRNKNTEKNDTKETNERLHNLTLERKHNVLENNIKRYKTDNIQIYQSTFTNLYYGICDKKEKSVFKVVVRDGTVIGLHLFGMGSDEIIQGFAVALKMGVKYEDFKRTIPVHPTAAEEVVTMK